MSQISRSLWVPFLAILATGLGGVTWWQATTPIDTSPIEPPASLGASPTPPAAEVTGDVNVKPLSALTETLQRPLFNSNRKPISVASAEAPTTAQPKATEPEKVEIDAGTLRLVGMVSTGQSGRRALIRLAGTPSAEWLEKGAEIGGWTLQRIENDKVVLMRDGTTAELVLRPVPVEKPSEGKAP